VCLYVTNNNNIIILFNLKVKEIEKRDSVLTGPQQIERLTRPGSTYFNLNPYEVNILVYFFLRGHGNESCNLLGS